VLHKAQLSFFSGDGDNLDSHEEEGEARGHIIDIIARRCRDQPRKTWQIIA
jgi:hypothetical protein